VSSDDVLQEELKEIDWADIDTYPAFTACDDKIEKSEQKSCFEAQLFSSLQEKLTSVPWVTSESIKDTIYLPLTIDTLGIIQLGRIEIDSLIQKSFPKLDSLIHRGITDLPTPAPAYKRGIPVQVKFTMPLVVASTEL